MARRADQSGEHRGLAERQVLRLLPEVELRALVVDSGEDFGLELDRLDRLAVVEPANLGDPTVVDLEARGEAVKQAPRIVEVPKIDLEKPLRGLISVLAGVRGIGFDAAIV